MGRSAVIAIKFRPGEAYPENVSMVIKFIQVFYEQSYILAFHIDYAKTSFFLGSASNIPSS